MVQTLTVIELVAIIATGVISDEHVDLCKQAAAGIAGKFITGEAISKDEAKILAFVSNRVQRAVAHADKHAETEAAKKAAEAKYEADLQKFELETFVTFATWLKEQSTEVNRLKSDKANVNRLSIEVLKGKFSAFIASVNELPSKPAKLVVKTSKGVSTGTYNSDSYSNPKPADVTKLVEGSISKCLYDTLCAGSYTKSELLKAIQTALPSKTEGAIRVAIEKAINGRFKVVTTGDKLSILPVALPDVPMEIVKGSEGVEK